METTLNIRKINDEAVTRAKRAASMRGWTIAEYFARLISLHDAMRALADVETSDGRYEQIRTELEALGLGSVRE